MLVSKLAHFVTFVPAEKTMTKKGNGLLIKAWVHTHFPKMLGWGTLEPRQVKNMIKMLCLSRDYSNKQFRKYVSNCSPYYYPVRWSPMAIKIFVATDKELTKTLCRLSCARKPHGASKTYDAMSKSIAENEEVLVKGIREGAGEIFFATSLFLFFATCLLRTPHCLFRTCFFCTTAKHAKKMAKTKKSLSQNVVFSQSSDSLDNLFNHVRYLPLFSCMRRTN